MDLAITEIENVLGDVAVLVVLQVLDVPERGMNIKELSSMSSLQHARQLPLELRPQAVRSVHGQRVRWSVGESSPNQSIYK